VCVCVRACMYAAAAEHQFKCWQHHFVYLPIDIYVCVCVCVCIYICDCRGVCVYVCLCLCVCTQLRPSINLSAGNTSARNAPSRPSPKFRYRVSKWHIAICIEYVGCQNVEYVGC